MRHFAVLLVGCLVACSSSSNQSEFTAPDAMPPEDSGRCCSAACLSTVDLTFRELNEGGRLDGAQLGICRGATCGSTPILTPLQSFEPGLDPGFGGVYETVTYSVGRAEGSLRFTIHWDVSNPVEGETFSVTARSTPDGGAGDAGSGDAGAPVFFTRTFTAQYTQRECCCATRSAYQANQ